MAAAGVRVRERRGSLGGLHDELAGASWAVGTRGACGL